MRKLFCSGVGLIVDLSSAILNSFNLAVLFLLSKKCTKMHVNCETSCLRFFPILWCV